MSNEMSTLIHSLKNKIPVGVDYSGGERVICVHAIGTKGERTNVLAYQVAGYSSSRPIGPVGDPGNWRCMHFNEMRVLGLRPDIEWGTADNHTQPSTCIDDIEYEVAY